jgi:hypothetical protein
MGGLLLLAFLLGLYFLPSMVAAMRSHRQSTAICMLNLFLGWTVLGWVGALVWACTNPAPPPTVIHQVIQSGAAPPATSTTTPQA